MPNTTKDAAAKTTGAPRAAKRHPPYFACYSSDWMGREEYLFASLSERGLFISCMNSCWVNQSIPADKSLIAKAIGSSEQEVTSNFGELMRKHFVSLPGNQSRLHCPELTEQLKGMRERSARLAAGGSKGGKATSEKNRQAALSQASSPATATEMNGNEMNRSDLQPVFKDEHADFIESMEAEERAEAYRKASKGGD